MSVKLEIQEFDQDYQALSELIHRSWPSEHKNFISYTPQYLESIIDTYDLEPELTLQAKIGDKMIGFVLSKKKRLSIQGKFYKALFNTLATTDPKYANFFPYLKMKDRYIKAAVGKGFDLNYGFAAWGIKNNQIEQFYAEKKGFQCHLAASFGALTGDLESLAAFSGKTVDLTKIVVRDYQSNDLDACLSLLPQATSAPLIYEHREPENLDAHFLPSEFSRTQVIQKGTAIVGLVNYKTVTMNSTNFSRNSAIIYSLLIDQLSLEQKKHVLSGISKSLLKAGVNGLSIPHTGYFERKSLEGMGFLEVPFPWNKTNLYISFFKDSLTLEKNMKFYLEII